MSYYTSYATSLALREAGAPRNPDGDRERAWYVSATRGGEPRLINATGAPEEVRAFRLDELLEALSGSGWQLTEEDNLDYVCGATVAGAWAAFASPPAQPWSPVEAAAACWLAVLRAAREVKP